MADKSERNESPLNASRRAALGTLAAGFVGAPVLAVGTYHSKRQPCDSNRNAVAGLQVSTPRDLVVETASGKVRGYVVNGIQTFQGMRYAASTAGALRFMPPAKPIPWTGIFDAVYWGNIAPQDTSADIPGRDFGMMLGWEYGRQNEDCLNLNVWTPSVKPMDKKPVMVWLHGGGFFEGSSREMPAYHGENLARTGDVVVVSVNHRLNAFGFLNLSELDATRFKQSGNVGLLDLVAALEWVRDNITSFGGDPANVTIFGQSGGGSKVCHLMASPSAKGLFNKAIVQSGPALRTNTPEESLRVAAGVLASLQIDKSNVDKILQLPAGAITLALLNHTGRYGPYLDGEVIPRHPFDPSATPDAAQIPLLIGNCSEEGAPRAAMNPAALDMTWEQLQQNFSKELDEKTRQVIDAFRYAHPTSNAQSIEARINCWRRVPQSLSGMAANTLALAEIKAAQPGAVYRYVFDYHSKVLDARMGCGHNSEHPYVFNNIDRCPITGGTDEARRVAWQISQAWVSFARTGNPGHRGLPHWPALKPGQPNAMVFDMEAKAYADFDGEGRKLLVG